MKSISAVARDTVGKELSAMCQDRKDDGSLAFLQTLAQGTEGAPITQEKLVLYRCQLALGVGRSSNYVDDIVHWVYSRSHR